MISLRSFAGLILLASALGGCSGSDADGSGGGRTTSYSSTAQTSTGATSQSTQSSVSAGGGGSGGAGGGVPCGLDGVIACWHADGDALDAAGAHDGVLENGASFAPGKVGQAFALDGVDDHVRVPLEDDFDFGAGPFSVTAWFKTVGGRTSSQHIFAKGDAWDGGDDDYVLYVAGQASLYADRAVMQVRNDASPYVVGTSLVANDAWHHVAYTRSGTCTGCARIYVDGALETVGDSAEIFDSVEEVYIGSTFGVTFAGLIDEVQVYGKELSADEIAQLAAD